MIIDFNKIEDTIIPQFKGGEGRYIMRHYTDEKVKIMFGRLEPGSSIGLHRHETNSEVMYILSGVATFICEGEEETVMPGQVHYNPMGMQHTLINRGNEDVTFYAVVPEHV